MGWLATVGKCVGYLFGRSTQRADFEAVYKQMDALANRLAREVSQYKKRVEELEADRANYKREIEREHDQFRDAMLAKFDQLYKVNDDCHKERRELIGRVAELESQVHQLQQELEHYRTNNE